MSDHTYSTALAWTGSTGAGYRDYDRDHTLGLGGANHLVASADAAFRGDSRLPNPEQLLVAAASSCQLLSFLAVAAFAGIDVVAYDDDATGRMPQGDSPMRITEIELRPMIRVRGADAANVAALVERAHEECYIANSLSGTVRVTPRIEVVS
ncbi:OsmC family protein [Microbacterium stercoris]|uniref:OsmC family protein n=1 Tax=Microbacterium stercoris TaxID=2820289 RepID=A0A939QSI7_9MICO|nr:OsmC family protein [Microbacterium stercoris]MBO3664776.1 OsmC family protein [Microbacterium stercoris]